MRSASRPRGRLGRRLGRKFEPFWSSFAGEEACSGSFCFMPPRLVTRPNQLDRHKTAKTIGIVEVAALAARGYFASDGEDRSHMLTHKIGCQGVGSKSRLLITFLFRGVVRSRRVEASMRMHC